MTTSVAMVTVCFGNLDSLQEIYTKRVERVCSRLLDKMPLFSSKFAPKTIPVRKQDTSVIKNEFGSDYAAKELSLDIGPLKLKLGDFEISLEDGQWIPVWEVTGDSWICRAEERVAYLEAYVHQWTKADDVLLDLASGKAGAAHKENLRLKKELEHLEEENNMLRLKFEILLDMMTDKTVEAEEAEMHRAQSLNSLKQRSKKQKW